MASWAGSGVNTLLAFSFSLPPAVVVHPPPVSIRLHLSWNPLAENRVKSRTNLELSGSNDLAARFVFLFFFFLSRSNQTKLNQTNVP